MLTIPSFPLLRSGITRKADPSQLRRVQASLLDTIDTLTSGVNAGLLTGDQFQSEMANAMLVGHTAVYLAGRDIRDLTPSARQMIARVVNEQLPFLNAFADAIEAGEYEDKQNALAARARLYAGPLRATYSRGQTFALDLPAHPGDGSTQCLVNCKCSWRIEWIDDENLDADCYWEMGTAEHCDDCKDRALQWNPIRIRGGVQH